MSCWDSLFNNILPTFEGNLQVLSLNSFPICWNSESAKDKKRVNLGVICIPSNLTTNQATASSYFNTLIQNGHLMDNFTTQRLIHIIRLVWHEQAKNLLIKSINHIIATYEPLCDKQIQWLWLCLRWTLANTQLNLCFCPAWSKYLIRAITSFMRTVMTLDWAVAQLVSLHWDQGTNHLIYHIAPMILSEEISAYWW